MNSLVETLTREALELIKGDAGDLKGFHIESALEFTIELDQPISFFPALLAFAPASIVPEGSETFDGNWQTGCAGAGPFRVVRFDPERRVELEANPLYWRKELPKSHLHLFGAACRCALRIPVRPILDRLGPASFRCGSVAARAGVRIQVS